MHFQVIFLRFQHLHYLFLKQFHLFCIWNEIGWKTKFGLSLVDKTYLCKYSCNSKEILWMQHFLKSSFLHFLGCKNVWINSQRLRRLQKRISKFCMCCVLFVNIVMLIGQSRFSGFRMQANSSLWNFIILLSNCMFSLEEDDS